MAELWTVSPVLCIWNRELFSRVVAEYFIGGNWDGGRSSSRQAA